jgi:enterochelin esterase-like enzyme
MTSARSLLRRLHEEGNPVVEGNRAIILWEGEKPPLLIGDTTGWDERPKKLKRLSFPSRQAPAQPVWSTSFTVPRDAYVEYAFLDPDSQEQFLDPFNQHFINNGVGSWNNFFYMPETMPSPFSIRRAEVRTGTLTRHRVDTWLMQDDGERDVYLYAPPARAPVPLLIVYDGPDYLHRARLTTIVENLIAAKRIRPVAIAFLQNARARRNVEYICSDATISWLDKEILPLARKHLRLVNVRENPGSYGALGASAGGIMAMYTGLRMPEIFGKVLSQSGVFALEGRDLAAIDLVRYRHAHYLKIWMDVGILDDLLDDNRRMSRLLREQEYHLTYREFSGGHNYTSWRDDVWRGLETLFPPIS